eukprot:Gb_04943 [translate_table: standard]
MEGESASSSQQVTSNAPPTGALPSPSITPSSGEVSTTNAGSIQQNSQQNQSGNNTIVGGGQSNVSSGPMHQNIMSNQPNFQQSQQRPGIAVNRGRQHTPYSHFSSMSGAGTPPSAMHPQRGGVQMPGIGMSAQQRPQALGGPYVHNLQQQQMGGIPRASMIGQHQGAGHPSMLSSGQAEQLSSMQSPYTTHQTRQKPVSIQSSPYQHPVSSGQPLQGMQTIGMMGSLGLGSQIRPSGVFSHTQQRPVQGSMRSQSPSQKMHAQNLPRVPSLGTMGSQLSGMSQGGQSTVVSSSLPHQQQWLPSQAKQMHQSNLSSLASPSYQPHPKQQSLQQRPQHGQPLQQSLPSTPQQQQQPPHQPQEQHSQQYQQQRMQQPLQAVPQQQQMLRTPGIPIQKPIITTGTQPATPASGTSTSAGSNDQASETSNQILGKRSLQELVAQIDPNEKLYPEVEDVLIEIADDFVESVTTFACALAKHRKSTTLEPKDILLHLDRNWHMTIPGFAGEEYKSYKRPFVSENHKQRLAVVQLSHNFSIPLPFSVSSHLVCNKASNFPLCSSLMSLDWKVLLLK